MWWTHEQVDVIHDAPTGLRAVIAIHSTVLGPALGGLRLRSYSGVDEAIDDALRLSEAMTFKAAAAGLDLGGGKSVMLDDGDTTRRADRLARLAESIEALGGRYITAEDVGTRTEDMDLIAKATDWVVGRSQDAGGGGDPSMSTARTVFGAIRHAARVGLGRDDLDGLTVGVIGLGKVGYRLAGLLGHHGVRVLASDIDAQVMERARTELGVVPHHTGEMLGMALDVLAPCAVGDMVDHEAARHLRVRVLAGGANNILTSPSVADTLAEHGVLYVPDYLANCGGLIHCSDELEGFAMARVERKLDAAVARIGEVLEQAQARQVPPVRLVEQRVADRLRRAAGGPACS